MFQSVISGTTTNNGLFTYQIHHNGAPAYLRVIPSGPCGIDGDIWLYYDGSSRWVTGSTLGGASISGRCTAAADISFPSCTSTWEGYNGAWTPISTMSFYADECPQWKCNGISIAGSTYAANCDGTFDIDPSEENAFKKQGSDVWVYYVPWINQWWCKGALDMCGTSFHLASPQALFTPLDQSDPPTNFGDLGTVTCLPFATDQPTTSSPTSASPTTASPTTSAPTTASPISASSTTADPTTSAPTTASPTSASPTSASPTSFSPTTNEVIRYIDDFV